MELAEVEQTVHQPHAAQMYQRAAQAILGQLAMFYTPASAPQARL